MLMYEQENDYIKKLLFWICLVECVLEIILIEFSVWMRMDINILRIIRSKQ